VKRKMSVVAAVMYAGLAIVALVLVLKMLRVF
jgi:hypothetical protein